MKQKWKIKLKYSWNTEDTVKDNRNVFVQLALISIIIFILLLEG